jgi:hypothetical protein
MMILSMRNLVRLLGLKREINTLLPIALNKIFKNIEIIIITGCDDVLLSLPSELSLIIVLLNNFDM